MTDFGFDKDRFPNLSGYIFDCPICTNVVRRPKECTGCGDLFCGKCIEDWTKKNKYFLYNTAPAPKDVMEPYNR